MGTVVGQLECVWAGGPGGGEGSASRRGSREEDKKKMSPEQAKMIDYIDRVMSIPSCVSSASSKVTMLNKWMSRAGMQPISAAGRGGSVSMGNLVHAGKGRI